MPTFLIISNLDYYPSMGLEDVIFISTDFNESRDKYIDVLNKYNTQLRLYQIQDKNILLYDLKTNDWIVQEIAQ